MNISIDTLRSGGLITNYYCNSRCKHCAYCCGPGWPRDYIDSDGVGRNLKALKRAGCHSVHIGGGEPLLDPERLTKVLEVCRDEGVNVEYVETNAGWVGGGDRHEIDGNGSGRVDAILDSLKTRGLDTLLISISPFHNEFIPWRMTRTLIEACGRTGISVFPWVEGFIPDITAFPEERNHSLDEYEERFGPGYVAALPSRYWVSPRGRAVETFAPYSDPIPTPRLLEANTRPCLELFDTSHFHVDLYGNYIPGVCTGLAVSVDDLGSPLDPDRYLFITSLMSDGLAGLYDEAVHEYGYEPPESCSGKCELCYDIRTFLVLRKEVDSPDLQPTKFYRQYRHGLGVTL